MIVTGGFSIGGATRGIVDTNSFQLNDDLTLVRGNHQFALGANVAYLRISFRTCARGGGRGTSPARRRDWGWRT